MTNNIDSPQARLAYYGPNALSNAELLSLVLRTGSKEKDAVSLARDIINYTYENLGDFGAAEVHELSEIYGVGEAKACSIVASMELAKRLNTEKVAQMKDRIVTSEQLAEMLVPRFLYEKQEHFMGIYLDTKMRIECQKTISIGTLESTQVHPRDVFAPALRYGAATLIVAHNHPSGDTTPSDFDISITNRLIEASRIMGIPLQDHLIIGNGCYMSLKDEGVCEFK